MTYEERLTTYNNYVGLAEHYGRKYNKKDRSAGEQSARVGLWNFISQPSVPSENIPTRYIKNAVLIECVKDRRCLRTATQAKMVMKCSKINEEHQGEDLEQKFKAFEEKYGTRYKSKWYVTNAIYDSLSEREGLFESSGIYEDEKDTDGVVFEMLPDDIPEKEMEIIQKRLDGWTYKEIGESIGRSWQAVEMRIKRYLRRRPWICA